MSKSELMRVSHKFKKYVKEVAEKKNISQVKTTEEFERILRRSKNRKKRKHDDWGFISVK